MRKQGYRTGLLRRVEIADKLDLICVVLGSIRWSRQINLCQRAMNFSIILQIPPFLFPASIHWSLYASNKYLYSQKIFKYPDSIHIYLFYSDKQIFSTESKAFHYTSDSILCHKVNLFSAVFIYSTTPKCLTKSPFLKTYPVLFHF